MDNQAKQIIITLPNYEHQQFECEDFLNECLHSPEWIGEPKKWQIKDIQCSTNKRGGTITAFIENHEWQTPRLTSITCKDLGEAINDSVEFPIKVSALYGLEGRVRNPIEYRHHTLEQMKDSVVFRFSDVFGMGSNTAKHLLEHLGYVDGKYVDEERDDNVRRDSMPVAITFDDITEIYPITEIRKEGNHFLLIYNTDFPVE